MKKGLVIAVICVFLAGCSTQETFETVADEPLAQVSTQMRQVMLQLPEEAAAPASQSEAGTLYLCDGYEITLQTLEAGDLDATIRSISGYKREKLTLIQTNPSDYKRFDLVWTSAGEAGERLGRAAVLDDGSYHYVLSVMADADRMGDVEAAIDLMFASFCLS